MRMSELRQQRGMQFVVGDQVAWDARSLVVSGRDVRAEGTTGVITSMKKGCVIVEYAPGKFRQVAIGTQNLRKVAVPGNGVISESSAIAEGGGGEGAA